MLSLLLVLSLAAADGSDVTRDFYGDIFRMRDCHNGSRCDNGGTRPALEIAGRPCFCQCAPTHLTYREDKRQCVKEIRECYMSVFYRPFTVEAIPLVYLPTSGQLVHPEAHLSLSGRKNAELGFPTCKAAVSQYLTPEGWRTLTKVDGGGPVFGLFIDNNKTFLQFLGNSHDRRLLQQHLAMVRLFCRIPEYSPFETCVAVRVGWVPGVDSGDEVESTFSKSNIIVVGLSLGILGLVYVFAVLVYLRIRRKQIAKRRQRNDHEGKLQRGEENAGNIPRLETSKRLELYHSTSMGRRKMNHEPWTQLSNVVETYNRTWTDRMEHGCEFRAQDFQLEPELFEPELMASPPQEVLEYLERLQSSVTFARHRLRSCYRYQPTLNGIPEDDYFYQELKNAQNDIRTTPDGGSSSSIASLLELSENSEDKIKGTLPKIPPRKPKRKTPPPKSSKAEDKNTISEQEQKDIQNAMNTLNDTLDALEYDIYKQDLLHKGSDVDTISASCLTSTEGDTEDFDSSSCSSLSAVTVLGRNGEKIVDINSIGSRSVERNQCEDFGTFSNSTFSVQCETKPGLFNHQTETSHGTNSSEESKETKHADEIQQSTNETAHNEANDSMSTTENSGNDAKASICEQNQCHGFAGHRTPDGEEANVVDDRDKGQLLRKSSSTESMTTTTTDMTSDSLDSRASSVRHRRRRRKTVQNQQTSLVDMWISRIIQNSVQYSKTKRKPKKMILTDDDIHGWEHVCHKQREAPPTQALIDTEPNLIDRLAHYSSKSMAGRDVSGYFQSLKQDILKDHLRSWLSSNSQSNKKGISVKYRMKESCPKKPLVPNDQEANTSTKNGFTSTWTTFRTVNENCEDKSNLYEWSNEHKEKTSTGTEFIDSLDAKISETKTSNGNVAIAIT